MEMRRAASNRLLVFGSLAAAVFFGVAAALPGRPEEKSGKSAAGAQVVQLLDGYVQKRFEQDNGRFGLSRLPPPVFGHDSIRYQLQADDSGEKEVLHAIAVSGFEYLVEFVHCSHVPARSQNPPPARPARIEVKGLTLVAAKSEAAPFQPYQFGKDREAFQKTTEEPIKKEAVRIADRLQKESGVTSAIGTWQVTFRPVRASKASCLKCHAGAKSGDLLGVMAYAVRQPIKSASSPVTSR